VELCGAAETLTSELHGLQAEQRSREQRQLQYRQHYAKLREETQTQIDQQKLDKIER
jgi:hypothetical protein